LDGGLALASAVECGARGIPFARDAGVPEAAGVVFGVLAGSVLLFRRRWPIAVVLVSIAVAPAQMGYLMGVVGLYTLAASELPRRIIASLAGMSLLGMLVVAFVQAREMSDADVEAGEWFAPFFALTMSVGMTAPPLLLGMYVGARRRLMESLRERADSLERELQLLAERAEERAEWARGEERTRIAREMHDVVAHRVSLMVVHAAALQAVARKDPEKAVKNAALVGDMGRQALTELREMLGVLRSGDGVRPREVPVVKVAAVDEQPVSEGPCLEDLEELVGQSAAAGMVVALTVEGRECAYAPEIEQTAYRVVQEALTNAHKHAAGAKTYVRVAHRVSEIAMQVENEPPPEVSSPGLPSGGNGLVGMRERVLALGGVFVSGPTEAGGFRVSAVIPAS
jgi:signal transduction histidine kinase